ncbi:TrmB family transcriptional regulator [Haloarchaeobius sp. DFWS5]|uniref:TrmB family transcriptional regulator n=1 Tax=Haloarchaeobius sp. DFWS5 TaxID=3446114 RepID=UPI003EBE5092
MDDTTLIDRLARLGLSEKEIDTYLTILDHGEAKASTIAQDAGVSKRYVYSVSEKLQARGFVEVNDHAVPTLIRANPPEEVVDRLTAELKTLGPDLSERWNRVTEDRREFEVVKARATVLKRIREFLTTATAEVTLSMPRSVLPEVADELRDTVERGVLVFLILTGDTGEGEPEIDGDRPVASVARVWEERAPVLFTVDTELGLFAPYDLLARANTGEQAVTIAQEQLVPVLVGSFFGNYWPMAEEAAVVEPTPLPKTFESFRQAVFEATLHRQAGVEVEATVEARPVPTEGDFETLTGRVVGVRQNLIVPGQSDLAVENSLTLDIGDRTISVGGPGAFVEDYEARSVRLEAVEDGSDADE